MRRFTRKGRDAAPEPDPFLCRHIRTKTWFAPDAFGEGDPRQSPSTAQYWCLRTMRPAVRRAMSRSAARWLVSRRASCGSG